jgi:hypothetical protein
MEISKMYASSASGRASVSFTDVRQMITILGQIDREHVKKLKARAREIAKPVEDAVRRGIPSTPPLLKGMTPAVIPGRLSWNTGFPANSTTIQTPRMAVKKKYNSIARVRTRSAALGLADMAGRSRKYMNKYAETKPYPYSGPGNVGGMRKHKNTIARSTKFIQNLNSGRGVVKNSPSRYVWPSGLKALPIARYKMEIALNEYVAIVNARLRG